MKAILFLFPIISLSACAVSPAPLGDAMAHNTKLQAIAPTPEQKENTFIPADSQRQRAARDAYRKGEVKELEKLSTQN